ncbi:MAG: hypothetical protein IIB87_03095 [Chloroflexi bacterium]|nr:hypothetical protein [Chloroflexota bacterium]
MKATRPRSQGANFGSADGLPDRQAGRTPLPAGRRRAGGSPLLVTALIAAVLLWRSRGFELFAISVGQQDPNGFVPGWKRAPASRRQPQAGSAISRQRPRVSSPPLDPPPTFTPRSRHR